MEGHLPFYLAIALNQVSIHLCDPLGLFLPKCLVHAQCMGAMIQVPKLYLCIVYVDVLGSGAVSYFTTGKKPEQWSIDDLYIAVPIRARHKCYSFFSGILWTSLSPSTLNRFLSRFKCEPIVFHSVLRFLR